MLSYFPAEIHPALAVPVNIADREGKRLESEETIFEVQRIPRTALITWTLWMIGAPRTPRRPQQAASFQFLRVNWTGNTLISSHPAEIATIIVLSQEFQRHSLVPHSSLAMTEIRNKSRAKTKGSPATRWKLVSLQKPSTLTVPEFIICFLLRFLSSKHDHGLCLHRC